MNWTLIIPIVESVLAWLAAMQTNGDFSEIDAAIQSFIAVIQSPQGQDVVSKVQALIPPKASS